MTWQIRGSGSNNTGSGTSTTITASAAPQSGDVILVWYEQDPPTSGNYGTLTGPTGFGAALDSANTTDWAKITLWGKVSDGTEGTSYTVSNSVGQSDTVAAVLIVYEDGGGSLSIGTPTTTVDTSSDTSWGYAGVTTTGDNSLVVIAVGGGGNNTHGSSAIFSGWGSFTERIDSAHVSSYSSVGVGTQVVATSGTSISAGSITSATTDVNVGITVEVKVAATGTTATPGAGSLTFAGLAPAVSIQPSTPGAGTLTLSGQEPQLATPIIAVGWIDQFDTWSYVGGQALVGGTQPSYVVGIVPEHGTLALAGLVPTVTVGAGGGGSTVAPDAGALAFTGLAPSLLTNYIPAPGAGALTLAGLSPSLLVATIAQPDAGTLTLAGLAPSLLVAQILQPSAGALVLSGLAPTAAVSDNRSAAPDAGALVLTGLQPAVLNGDSKVAQPDAGALVLAGLQPAVAATDNRTAAPGTGALVLAGLTPTVLSGFAVAPSSGALALTGLQPSLSTSDNRTVAPDVGALVLAGLAPSATVSDNLVVQPGTGALVLAGLVPEVPQSSPTATPDPGALTLTGLEPTVTTTGDNVLDPKFLGRGNVRVKLLRKEKPEPDEPLPADITNMPDAPPPPRPLGKGLDFSQAQVEAPEPVTMPAVEPPKVVRRAAPPAEPVATPAPIASPTPPAAPPPPDPMEVLQSSIAGLGAKLDAALKELAALRAQQTAAGAVQTAVKNLTEQVVKDSKTRDLRERNVARARAITERILKDLAERD